MNGVSAALGCSLIAWGGSLWCVASHCLNAGGSLWFLCMGPGESRWLGIRIGNEEEVPLTEGNLGVFPECLGVPVS
jgi:hypothetical protein